MRRFVVAATLLSLVLSGCAGFGGENADRPTPTPTQASVQAPPTTVPTNTVVPTTPPASTATRPPATNTSVPPTVVPAVTQTPVVIVVTATPGPASPTAPVQPTTTPVVIVVTATPSGPTNPTQPSATPVRPPTGGNLQPQPGGNPVSGGVCRLDKIGTWSEVSAAGPQRIEVGGGGTQHADLYPARGVKAVSFIVSPREPMIYMGYGSIWEGNGNDCVPFNWIQDATDYARGRLNNGHSGIVVDLRGNQPAVVANVANMSESDVASLLKLHLAALSGGNVGNYVLQGSIPALAATPGSGSSVGSASGQGCPRAQESTMDKPTNFAVSGPAVIQPWWNISTPWGQTQVRVKLLPGESVTIVNAMGKAYTYENSQACVDNLDKEFNSSSFPIKTVAELKAAGLAR